MDGTPASVMSFKPHTHTHRVAAEDQVHGLQSLIDETFQQFALDDSEDDFFDFSDEGSTMNLEPTISNGHAHSTPALNTIGDQTG